MTGKYLLHMTQADRWPAAISNLGNLRKLGLAKDITVLINGTAIYVVQGKNDWVQSLKDAAAEGVTFEICERSLANHGFPPESVPTWIKPIWAAVPVIAEHVADGYTYIKP